jgi:hypothetical protein
MAINSYLRSSFSVDSVSNGGRKQTAKTLYIMRAENSIETFTCDNEHFGRQKINV